MNWLKKFGSLCLAVVLSVCLLAQDRKSVV